MHSFADMLVLRRGRGTFVWQSVWGTLWDVAGRYSFILVMSLVCLGSALQLSSEFHREREREKTERNTWFSAGAQQQQHGSSSNGCLDRWKANYWMGFLSVCWEEQRIDGIYRQKIKLLEWRYCTDPSWYTRAPKKALTTARKVSYQIIFINKSCTSALSPVTENHGTVAIKKKNPLYIK